MSTSTKALSFLIGALVVLSLFSVVAMVHVAAQRGAGAWQYETPDTNLTGRCTSIALDASGYPHISHLSYDNSGHLLNLIYTYKDASGWHTETVGTAISTAGGTTTSIALDSHGNPHIAYFDQQQTQLKYAHKVGGSWDISTLDTLESWNAPSTGYCSIALDTSDNPHISYCLDGYSPHVGYASYDGTHWNIENVDEYGSLALASQNNPHIAFFNGSLGYMYKESGSWQYETADSSHLTGWNPSLALDSSNSPHIAYFNNSLALKYAYKDVSGWHSEFVDTSGSGSNAAVFSCSLALDSQSSPHICWSRVTAPVTLEYTYKDVSGWHTEAVGAGNYGALTLDFRGDPHISYFGSGHLHYATKNIVEPTTLTIATPATALVTKNFTISGTLSANATSITDATINLQRSVDNATWNNVTTNVTNATGGYRFSTNESSAHTYYYRTAYDGNATYGNATSDVVTVQVDKIPTQLSAVTNLTSVATNKPFTISGTLKATDGTSITGATIQLQQNVSGTWTDVTGKTNTTTSTGEYRIGMSEQTTGVYQYRTTYAGNATYANATSNVVSVTITPNWNMQLVDNTGNVGLYTSLRFNSTGSPSISYYDAANGDLKYANKDTSGWHAQVVDSTGDVGRYSSLTLTSAGYPAISYYDATNGDLKYAYQNAVGWHIQTVDSTGDVGQYCSLALTSTAWPAISYFDATNGNLKYAYKNAAGWHTQVVDSAGDVGQYTSLALTSTNWPAISYFDGTNNDLKYTYKNAAGWHTQTVDNTGDVGTYTSLALTTTNWPAISYYDYTNTALKYTYKNAAGWHTQTVDSTGDVGQYTSLALTSTAWPAISYYDVTNHVLKYTYKNAAGWHNQVVDIAGDVGQYTSLRLTSAGWPAIAYYDGGNADLKYTYKSAS